MRSSLTQPRPSGELVRGRQYTTPQAVLQSPHSQRSQTRPAPYAARSRLSLAPAEGWLAMLLLAVAVYMVVISIISSGWVSANKNLVISTAVGLLIGLLVGMTTWPQAWYLRGPVCGLLMMLPVGLVALATPGCGGT